MDKGRGWATAGQHGRKQVDKRGGGCAGIENMEAKWK